MNTAGKRDRQFATAAMLLGLLVALLLAETALRLAKIEYPLYPTRFQFGFPDSKTLDTDFVMDPVIQWKPKEYDQTLQEWQGKRIDMLHMGDSCTQLGRYRADLLELMQQQHPEKDFQNLKLAVAGWSSYQGLQQLQRDIVPLQPRYITIYFGWNDHWLSYGLPDKAMDFSKARYPLYRLLHASRLFQLFSQVYNHSLQGQSADDRPLRVSAEDYRHNLQQMVRIAREHGITPILLTAPSSHRVGQEPGYLLGRYLTDLSQLVPLHAQYNNIVREVAQQQQVLLLDLAQEFDALPYETVRDQYMKYDGIHLWPAGSRAIAESLYRFSEQHKLLE